jgi:hypothetical protein
MQPKLLDDLPWYAVTDYVMAYHHRRASGAVLFSMYWERRPDVPEFYVIYDIPTKRTWSQVSKLTAQCVLNHLLNPNT